MKQVRQHEPAEQQRGRQQGGNPRHRKHGHHRLQIVEARLQRDEQDDEDVLQHQDAERDAAGQRVELALVVQQLHDDDGAAERGGGREIERIPARAADRHPEQQKKSDPERAAADDLHGGGHHDGAAGTDDLLEVDLQPDHEQQEDQAELGDGGDRFRRGDEAQSGRPEDETGGEIGEKDRLAGDLGGQAQEPGHQDAEGNMMNQLMHRYPPPGRRHRCGNGRGKSTSARAADAPGCDGPPISAVREAALAGALLVFGGSFRPIQAQAA